MTQTYFEEMMAGQGARSLDGVAMGESRGLPYSAELETGGEKQRVVFRFALGADPAPAVRRLRGEKLSYLRFEKAPDGAGGILIAALSPPSDFYMKSTVHTLFARLHTALEQTGLAAPPNCPLCGLPGCDSRAYTSGAFRPVHAACLARRLNGPQPAARARGGRLSGARGALEKFFWGALPWFTGVFGALAGALLGALPIWALALSRGRLYAVLYLFIPFLSALLYRLARGRAGLAAAGITVLAASLLASFALEQVWYWLWYTAQTGGNVSFAETAGHYFAVKSFAGALKDMWLNLLIVMVGFVASGVILRRYVARPPRRGPVARGNDFARASAALSAGLAGGGESGIPEENPHE